MLDKQSRVCRFWLWKRDLSLPQNVRLRSVAHSASHSNGTEGYYPKIKAKKGENHHQTPSSAELAMSGSVPPFLIYIHGKHINKFSFILACKLARETHYNKEIWFVKCQNILSLCNLLPHGFLCSIRLYTRVVLPVEKLSLCVPKITHKNILGWGVTAPDVLNVWPCSFNLQPLIAVEINPSTHCKGVCQRWQKNDDRPTGSQLLATQHGQSLLT